MFFVCVVCVGVGLFFVFFFKQKTAYEMRISDWSSDVCSSDLRKRWRAVAPGANGPAGRSADKCSGRRGPRGPHRRPCSAAPSPLLVRLEAAVLAAMPAAQEIGRASGRERVCQYVSIFADAVTLKHKK